METDACPNYQIVVDLSVIIIIVVADVVIVVVFFLVLSSDDLFSYSRSLLPSRE